MCGYFDPTKDRCQLSLLSWSSVICADKGLLYFSVTLEQDQLTASLGTPSSPSDHLQLIFQRFATFGQGVGRAQILKVC